MLETVIPDETGCFWSGGPTELAAAVLQFDDAAVLPEVCVRNAEQFGREAFRRGILAQVRRARSQDSREPVADRRPLASTRLVRRTGAFAYR